MSTELRRPWEERVELMNKAKEEAAELLRAAELAVAAENSYLPEGCKSIEEAVLRFEGLLIKGALQYHEGSITKAAATLGTSYQQLDYVLESRQQAMKVFRTEKRRRQSKLAA